MTFVQGDEAWQLAPLRSPEERKQEIIRLGKEWTLTDNNEVPGNYIDWLENVSRIFGSEASLDASSKKRLTEGLVSLHAFTQQMRFVKGGAENLPEEFWRENGQNTERVRESLKYLLFGSGEFIQRLHDFLYDPGLKLARFSKFSALELYGTVKPDEFPPINGRMAKALRYLGFKVRGK